MLKAPAGNMADNVALKIHTIKSEVVRITNKDDS